MAEGSREAGTFRVLIDQMLPQIPHGEEVALRACYLGTIGYAPGRAVAPD